MALAVSELVIVDAGGLIVITRVAVPVPAPFVAPMVTLVVPTDEGVPVIAPVLVLIDKPEGRPVAL